MSPVALVVAGAAGLLAGRAGLLAADRFAPPRGARRRFPVQEAATAAAAVVVVARFGVGWAMGPPLVAAVSLVTLSAVDLRAYRLPDMLVGPSLGLSLAAVAVHAAAVERAAVAATAVAAGLGLGALLWVLHEIRPGALGFGDVKLGPLLGLHLGWASAAAGGGWAAAVVLAAQALLASSLIGLAMGLMLALLRRRGLDPLPDPDRPPEGSGPPGRERLRDTVLPFGPALAAGTMIAVLFAVPLLD